MPKARVRDCAFNYVQMGAGSDVVLVHGLGANLAFWSLVLLRRLSARFRVTAYDLRGHGYSDMTPTGYESARMAEDLLGLLDALGIARAHLVGHSYGGTVALQAAVRAPARVVSLTLADARVPALQPRLRPEDFPHGERWWACFREAGIEVPEDQPLDFTLLELMADARWSRIRERLGGGLHFVPFEGWNAGRRSAARWTRLLETTSARAAFQADRGPSAADLRTLEQPTLAIYGEYSHCLPTGAALPRHLRSCRAVTCPGSGHFHPAVKPDLFAASLVPFLDEVERARGRSSSAPA